jgi:hypothetical protein
MKSKNQFRSNSLKPLWRWPGFEGSVKVPNLCVKYQVQYAYLRYEVFAPSAMPGEEPRTTQDPKDPPDLRRITTWSMTKSFPHRLRWHWRRKVKGMELTRHSYSCCAVN